MGFVEQVTERATQSPARQRTRLHNAWARSIHNWDAANPQNARTIIINGREVRVHKKQNLSQWVSEGGTIYLRTWTRCLALYDERTIEYRWFDAYTQLRWS